jgi:hypothetical protein
MLIYCRKEPSSSDLSQSSGNTNGGQSMKEVPQDPIPPARTLEVISALNAAHDEACERFLER